MHLARGNCSFMGSLFKVPLARGCDPYMSVFTKFTSRVVVVRSLVRFSKFHSRVVVRLRWFVLGYISLG